MAATQPQNFTKADGVSLKEYFEVRLEAMDKALNLAQETNKIHLANMCDDIDELKDYKARLEGKASQGSVNLALLISAVGIIIGIINLLK